MMKLLVIWAEDTKTLDYNFSSQNKSWLYDYWTIKDFIKNGAIEEIKPVLQSSKAFKMDYQNRIELIFTLNTRNISISFSASFWKTEMQSDLFKPIMTQKHILTPSSSPL